MDLTLLIEKFPLISDQISKPELHVVLRECEQALTKTTEGDIVEFGCYIGTTSLFLQRMLDIKKQKRKLHVYDSFAGLPPKTPQDENAAGVDFVTGELAVSKREFITQFRRANVQLPIIHKAWFDELSMTDLPPKIAFAFLDGDYYKSINTSLALVWPRLVEDGVVLVHDYNRETLPGVAQAVTEFFAKKPVRLQIEKNVAILTPH